MLNETYHEFQMKQSDCGLACIVMIGRYKKLDITVQELNKMYFVPADGLAVSEVIQIGRNIGVFLKSKNVKKIIERYIKYPSILAWNGMHYVVLNKYINNSFEIYDPYSGIYEIHESKIEKYYSGVLLELEN